MTLDELRSQAAELFPIAVDHAINKSGESNAALDKLNAMCWVHFGSLGFDCMADCFDAVVPKCKGELTIKCWSEAEIKALPWTLKVRCRPFHHAEHFAHLEVYHDGPLPNVTETGYRAMFVPMAAFADRTPDDFIRKEVCKDLPKSSQMTLF
ncbi:hypothetical protein ACFSSA_09270 [Luteolibacter algae]|uniref:Uncharacterized protein n=1 Tax=Luteolibacter algae TaxID=454151 RepID=A0ABW5D7Z8_9BACT